MEAARQDPEGREHLKSIIDEIAQAAKDAIEKPKNVAKGGWLDSPDDYLAERLYEETVEFVHDAFDLSYGAVLTGLAESGDVVAFMAMMLDKKRKAS